MRTVWRLRRREEDNLGTGGLTEARPPQVIGKMTLSADLKGDQVCDSWSSGEPGGNPVTTEERRRSLCRRRILARAIARAPSAMAAQSTNNTTATTKSADVWFIPSSEYGGVTWY